MTQAEYLPDFILAYLACALWSTTDDKGEPLDNEFAVADIPADVRDEMSVDCRTFVDENWSDLKDLDPSQCGHDFWLTRNGEGAGFWDRGLGDVGDRLTKSCGWKTKYPPVDLYVGDDGKLYAN